MDTQHNLYGTTFGGPDCACGVLFKLAPDGTYTVLHIFRGSGGIGPYGDLLRVGKGTFYGTTFDGGVDCGGFGCGTVFSFTTGGKFNLVYSFKPVPDAYRPFAGLINKNHRLYGVGEYGGASGGGAVFSVTE